MIVVMSFSLDNTRFSTSAEISQEAPPASPLPPVSTGSTSSSVPSSGNRRLAATARNATGG